LEPLLAAPGRAVAAADAAEADLRGDAVDGAGGEEAAGDAELERDVAPLRGEEEREAEADADERRRQRHVVVDDRGHRVARAAHRLAGGPLARAGDESERAAGAGGDEDGGRGAHPRLGSARSVRVARRPLMAGARTLHLRICSRKM